MNDVTLRQKRPSCSICEELSLIEDSVGLESFVALTLELLEVYLDFVQIRKFACTS